MKTIRVLIVDDEKPGRERLRHLVNRDRRLELAACCASGAEALQVVRDAENAGRPVQLMFLDVQMPEVDGFDVVSDMVRQCRPECVPATIFVTAHDEYALRAFDAHAINYLLKPFSDERFHAALDRALRYVRAGNVDALASQMQALLDSVASAPAADDRHAVDPRGRAPVDRIVLKGSNRVRLLPVDQISWIEADGMYVKLHLRDGGVHLHRALLGALDSVLDERRFVRIHRSGIVNIDVVDELRQDAHGDYVALLRDRTEIRVGRHFRERLQARLGQNL